MIDMGFEKPAYWGNLKKGRYNSDFKRIYAKDYARTYNLMDEFYYIKQETPNNFFKLNGVFWGSLNKIF